MRQLTVYLYFSPVRFSAQFSFSLIGCKVCKLGIFSELRVGEEEGERTNVTSRLAEFLI
jgi:hypothetical protein